VRPRNERERVRCLDIYRADDPEESAHKGPRGHDIHQTTEGFSVFSGDFNDLGKQVALLRGGTIFGELGLINDAPRGASIRCQTDCDVLVIRKQDFDRVLKEEMMRAGDEKLNFLTQHVPGMRDLEVPRFAKTTHPAYFLRRTTYRRGHLFLSQGVVAQDAIYVVFKGCLEMRVRDTSKGTPGNGIVRHRPQAKGRPRGAIGYANLGNKTEGADERQGVKEGNGHRILGTLMTGSVFGSLPMQAPEPYSVVVSSSSCEVFQAIGPDMPKLPRRLLEQVREYIATSTAWRLRTYMNHKSHFEMPKASDVIRSESPPVSGARTSQEQRYFSLIHAT